MASSSLRDEIGDFVGIPNSFIEDDNQTAESRVVFMLLRYHTHRKRKRAFPGFDTLMRETGLKRQKTAEGIAVLVKTGWLVKHRQFGRPTEYELRYPDSSTGELSEGRTIVPQADHDSSTGGSSPLITTKTEFTKMDRSGRSNGYKKPKTLKYLIAEFEDPDVFDPGHAFRDYLHSLFPALPVDEFYKLWYLSRFRQGGIKGHLGKSATIEHYQADMELFFRNCEGRENGNGFHEPKPVQRVQTIRERLGLAK